MRRKLIGLLLIGTLTLLFLISCSQDTNILSASEKNIEDQIKFMEDRVDEYLRNQNFNGSVLLAKRGEIIFKRGYGMADFDKSIPNTPDTIYQIGSLTMPFTSLAIMMLQEEGLLNTNDTIDKYLPYFPNGDRITIHHLLTHTSGVPEIRNISGFYDTMTIETTVKSNIEKFMGLPLDFEPGSTFDFNNSGYILLGAIIEEVSGINYEEYIYDKIINPVGLINTGYDISGIPSEKRAIGYKNVANTIVPAKVTHPSVAYSSGGLYSNVEDLYHWYEAIVNNQFISKDTAKLMFTPNKRLYAYGWMINNRDENLQFHVGDIDGFEGRLLHYLDEDNIIIILSNQTKNKAGLLPIQLSIFMNELLD